MRLSQTGLTQNDKPDTNNDRNGSDEEYYPWVKIRSMIGYPIEIVAVTPRHVEESYLPTGAHMKEHDELVITFQFEDKQDEFAAAGINPSNYGRYRVSTGAKRIISVLENVTEEMMPLEGVVIFVDPNSSQDYPKYYLASTEDAQPTHRPTATPPSRPTGNGQARGAVPPSNRQQGTATSRGR